MNTLSDVSQRENTYVIDSESGAETARLMHQHRLVTAGMGGLFPEPLDVSQVQHILDIACGPGDWALDVAFEYPEIEVIAIDLSRTMVEYAHARAGVQGLDNARFCVMDALQPLVFPDDAFDLVNARFLCGCMPTTAWPALLKECVRVTRPGGVICLTEAENGISTGSACEQISAFCARAMQGAGHSFSPDGRHLGITPLLGHFLLQAGCQHIQQQAHVIDYSVDTDLHRSVFANFNVLVEVLKPFLMRMGVITGDELEYLHREATIEMLSDDFCGVWFLLRSRQGITLSFKAARGKMV